MEVSVVPGCENGERGIESEFIGNSLCIVIDGDSGTEGVSLICVNEEKNNHQEIVDDGAGPCSSNNNLIVSEKTTGCVAPSSAVLESTDESIEAPSVGMVFESWEDVESYYKGYGKQQGFGVSRVASAFRQGKDSMKIRRAFTWRCECYGKPDLRAIREAKKRAKGMEVGGCKVGEHETRAKRKSKKCECSAMVYASINKDGGWELKRVVLKHLNHNPTPMKAKLGKEYVKESFAKPVKSRLFNDCNSGFQVSQIHGSLAMERDGIQNMPVTKKDMRHLAQQDKRLRMEGGDVNVMMNYFEGMQRDNQNFFHAKRLDENGYMKDVIWADARSRVAYEEFGDVVYFDTTYLTNKYELPLANFVGVNHHGQSVLFGCALVSREDEETYTWVFRQWLLCMRRKTPDAILTDEVAAIRKGIADVMPATRHRWCVWRILQNLPKKLGTHPRYHEMNETLKDVIYRSYSVEEFETRWGNVLTEFNVVGNDWLSGLFDERSMWVPAFMKDTFWAGMKTTQRVESTNSFFDNYVKRHTKLFEFAEKYCAAMEQRVIDDEEEDIKSMKYARNLVTGFKAEKVFQKAYTDKKFQEVQKECERLTYCYSRGEKFVGEKVEHLMEDRVWVVPNGCTEEVLTDRRMCYRVTYNSKTREVECDCKMFETHGILCRHCIRVLDQHLFGEVPNKYILLRWRKDIPRKHSKVKVAYHDPLKTVEMKRYEKMMVSCEDLCDNACVAEETMSMVIEGLKSIKVSVNDRLRSRQLSNGDVGGIETSTEDNTCQLHDPEEALH